MMCAIANPAKRQSGHRIDQPQPSPPLLDFDALALLSIFNHEQQITVVERPVSATITQYLQSASPMLGRGFQLTLQAGESVAQRVLNQRLLPQHTGHEFLLADIALLAHLYLDLMGCPRIGLRLEVLQNAMCPKFHVDRTGIRLLCTYMGPGTEWLDDHFVERSQPGTHNPSQPHADAEVMPNTTGLHQVPMFAIALLKGSMWQGNTHRGVIHRSPVVAPGQTRVMLAIDALW